ncbi:hypothetical protein ACL6C3_07770 [Capilliphycus salinus ALCB114379]|uniref:hypothetical protein n=1 Tax=Capilliphycus salinus TaxID=2768948 RepID=UPI0039A6DFD5
MFPELSEREQRRSHPIPNQAMPPSHSNSSGAVVQKLKQRHWLELAEYISLLSSAVGSVVVALSGQAFYGVAPLTVALSLNVANRYRVEQQVERCQQEVAEVHQSMNQLESNAVRAVWLIRQQLTAEIAALREKQEQLPDQDSLETTYRAKQVAILTENVSSIQDNISIALEEMRQQLHQEIATTQQHLQGVNGQVYEIQQAIAALQKGQPIPPYQPDVDLGQLQAQLNQLSYEHQEIIKPHLKRLILAIKQLQTVYNRPLPRPPKPLSKEPIQEN